MFPEAELRKRLARIAATFPADADADAALARVLGRRRRRRPLAGGVAVAVALTIAAAGILVAHGQARLGPVPVAPGATAPALAPRPPGTVPAPPRTGTGFVYLPARLPVGMVVGPAFEQPVDHPYLVDKRLEPLDGHAGDVPRGPSVRLAYRIGDPAGGALWLQVYRTTLAFDPAREAARYPYAQVRGIRGHQGVELAQLDIGRDGLEGRGMAERIWLERPGLLVRVLSYDLPDAAVDRLIGTLRFPPDQHGRMVAPQIELPAGARLDHSEPVLEDRAPVLAREFWVELDPKDPSPSAAAGSGLLVRSARDVTPASLAALARRHACARRTTVRGHDAWVYARDAMAGAGATCQRNPGLAIAWIEHGDVAIEVAGQGGVPVTEAMLKSVAAGLRPATGRELAEIYANLVPRQR